MKNALSILLRYKLPSRLTPIIIVVVIASIVRIFCSVRDPSSFMMTSDKKDNTASSQSAASSIEKNRSPHNQTGSWIGNNWIPPSGWKLYSKRELQEFYRDKSVLWVGDSTARRAAMSMYAILNSTLPHVSVNAVNRPGVIDVNKRKVTENCTLEVNGTIPLTICRRMPFSDDGSKHFLVASQTACTHEMNKFIQDEHDGNSTITQNIDLIIISIGIWDALGRCGRRSQAQLYASINETIFGLNQLQARGKTIVWRTSGFSDHAHTFANVPPMNQYAMDLIDQYVVEYRIRGIQNNLTYVDWGGAIKPRSRSPERIEGDLRPHYGLEPRLVLIQMITNVLDGL